MEVERKLKVAFGSTLDREMFPSHVPPTRFGNDLTPIRGAPKRGPGCYNNEEVSNFIYSIKNKITSEKGYSLGARTAPRFRPDSIYQTPAPTHYQTTCTDAKGFTEEFKPFGAAAKRFPVYKRDVEETTPGAGTYEHDIGRDRSVQWHQSFGGMPTNLPSIKIHSTIQRNTDKLVSTKEEKRYNRRLAYLKLHYE